MKLALYKGTGIVSRLIRIEGRNDYTHAAALLEDGSLIEAWAGAGVRHGDPGVLHADGTPVDIFRIPGAKAEHHEGAEEFMRARVGAGYDYRSLFGFLGRTRTDADQRRWFCSELVTAAWISAGYPLLRAETAPPWVVSPSILSMSPLIVPEATAEVCGAGLRLTGDRNHAFDSCPELMRFRSA